MSTIRPKDLNPGSPTLGSALVFDNGSEVLRTDPATLVDIARPKASQAEAETGSDNAKYMTPLRVKQALDSQTVGKSNASAIGIAGSANDMGTFSGSTIPDNVAAKTALQALETAVESAAGSAAIKVNATAVGVAATDSNMGTYTGSTISDNQTAKQNIQQLETAHETYVASLLDNAAGSVAFQRATAAGVPITSAAKVPAYLKLSAKRDLIDFIDKSYWPGMRNTTPPSVTPQNSLGQDSFAAALADMAAYPDRKLNLPGGWVTQSSAWTLNDQYFDIRGEGPENTVLRTLSATADQIVISNPFCRVEGIQFANAVARTAGAAVHVLYTGDHCEVHDIFGFGAFNLLSLDGHPSNPALDHGVFNFSNLRAYDTVATGTPFVIGGGYDVILDRALCVASGARCANGIRVFRCADLRITRAQILSTVRALNALTSVGNTIASLKAAKSYFGTSSLGSQVVSNGGSVLSADFEDCWFGEADDPSGRGFSAIGTSGTFAGLKMRGCEHFLNASDGCYIDTVKGAQLIGPAADGNGGSGIAVLNSPNPIVIGIRSGAARFSGNAVGLYETGNTKGRFDGNVTGNTTNFTSASTGSVTTGLITV